MVGEKNCVIFTGVDVAGGVLQLDMFELTMCGCCCCCGGVCVVDGEYSCESAAVDVDRSVSGEGPTSKICRA